MAPDGLSFRRLLTAAAGRFPHRPLMRWGDPGQRGELSRTDALRRVEAIARGLWDEGFRPGDRCFVLRNEQPGAPLTCLAVWWLGGVLSSFMLPTPDSMRRVISVVRPRWILTPTVAAAEQFGLDAGDAEKWISLGPDPETPLNVDGLLSRGQSSPSDLPDEPAAEDLAAIFCTSGTTGPAKAVAVSRQALLTPIQSVRQNEAGAWQTYCLDRPFNNRTSFRLFIDCWVNGNCYGLSLGSRTVDENLAALEATIAVLSPSYYMAKVNEIGVPGSAALQEFLSARHGGIKPPLGLTLQARLAEPRLRQRLARHLPPTVRVAISNSAPLPGYVSEFFAGYGLTIQNVYGSTECGPVAFTMSGCWKPGTVGKPAPRAVVRLDPDGEVLVRSVFGMTGYYGDPVRTAKAMEDGWIRTGDVGRFDEDGFLVLAGRRGRLIVQASGHKVDPEAVQTLLEADPQVERAFVFGEGQESLIALLVVTSEEGWDALTGRLAARLRKEPRHLWVQAFAPIPPPPATDRFSVAYEHAELLQQLFAGCTAENVGRFGEPLGTS